MHRTRAKFYVESCTITNYSKGQGGNVVLKPVTRGEENREWSSATPIGKIEMSITNPEAFAQFVLAIGEELYVDFTSAEETPAS